MTWSQERRQKRQWSLTVRWWEVKWDLEENYTSHVHRFSHCPPSLFSSQLTFFLLSPLFLLVFISSHYLAPAVSSLGDTSSSWPLPFFPPLSGSLWATLLRPNVHLSIHVLPKTLTLTICMLRLTIIIKYQLGFSYFGRQEELGS